MLTSPWLLLVGLPLGFLLLVGLAAAKSGGFWNGAAPVFAGMGVTCFVLGLLVAAARRSALSPPGHGGRRGEPVLSGGPTARQVRHRTAALYAENPADTPDELAARVRAWYGGGTVSRRPNDPDGCAMALFLWPVWLVRDALVAPTREEYERSVSDAVAAVTGHPPPAGRGW